MKDKILFLSLAVMIAFLIFSCGKQVTEPEDTENLSGSVTLKGQIVEAGSGSPVGYAALRILDDKNEHACTSDSLGVYKTEITIEKAGEIKIIASKDGYKADTVGIYVTAGKVFDTGTLMLRVENFAILKGAVVDRISGNALTGAVIRVISASRFSEAQGSTDAGGRYSLTVPMDNNKQLSVIAFKEGYYADTLGVYASAGRNIDIPLFKLRFRNSVDARSGSPASIYLVSQSAQSIGVKQSGSVETATLVWEVQDSLGTPVDMNHSADVFFRIGVTPGGGEFISPASTTTNALGRVTMNLSSGIKSGVVQLIAEVRTLEKTILSKPVSIAIHGGLPDQAHFSVAAEKLNIPGYNINGIIDQITAYTGDKYGNPVRPKTAIYFTTDGAYIEGSALTDGMGLGTVRLISADPRPEHPELGKGFATITAKTADENYNPVKSQTIILFSGLPYLSVSPGSVDIPHLGSQTFTYTLKDQNNNPLSSGTRVSVKLEGEKLKARGDVDVLLPDTQSRNWTQFSFTVVNEDSTNNIRPVYISISTEGPNGSDKISISGVAK